MAKRDYIRIIKEGLIRGFGWSIGVTLGFAFVSTVVILGLRLLGGLPLIGDLIANIVEATNASLLTRTPLAQ